MCSVSCSVCSLTGFVQISNILLGWLLENLQYRRHNCVYKCIFAQINSHIIILLDLPYKIHLCQQTKNMQDQAGTWNFKYLLLLFIEPLARKFPLKLGSYKRESLRQTPKFLLPSILNHPISFCLKDQEWAKGRRLSLLLLREIKDALDAFSQG